MKVALYLRVSTDEQRAENQRPALEAIARQRGHEIVAVYEDADVSGTKLRRPGLDRLMTDAARAQFGAVLVWAIDRFARDGTFSGGLRLMGELEHAGVRLVSHQEAWLDTTGPWAGPLAQLVLRMAQEERARILARAREGRERARAEIAARGYAVSRKSGRVIRSLGRPGVSIPADHADAAAELRRQGLSWRDVSREMVTRYRAPVYHKASLRRAVQSRLGFDPAKPPSEAA